MHNQSPKAVTCPAIDGIIEETNDIAGEIDDKDVLDAALIASAQAVEHYEITRYGTLVAWAKQLGRADCASVLSRLSTRSGQPTSSYRRWPRARSTRRRSRSWTKGVVTRPDSPPVASERWTGAPDLALQR